MHFGIEYKCVPCAGANINSNCELFVLMSQLIIVSNTLQLGITPFSGSPWGFEFPPRKFFPLLWSLYTLGNEGPKFYKGVVRRPPKKCCKFFLIVLYSYNLIVLYSYNLIVLDLYNFFLVDCWMMYYNLNFACNCINISTICVCSNTRV